MSSHKKILFPVDGSVHSERAFDWYLAHFMQDNDEMIFLHVHHTLENVPQQTTHESDEEAECSYHDMLEIKHAAEKKSRPIMERFEKKCIQSKVRHRTMVAFGSPSKEICQTAANECVSCIVMGNRGLGVFRRSVLGSVSDSVIHKSRIPVMLVPPA
ncbi:uncharacterized protein LOC116298935 isoform X2 [Actinia tenebrosa]|uniref:Uncharacterized protein LOC116298935 isoform X2 n=1 Tax=Actinia tenebrosa TaxID=6105 RepID=A0A6P8ICF1_ACTTE|nr:uncharacterized protein LOC116298935 isoform X2 [Actinia tenebrosa]